MFKDTNMPINKRFRNLTGMKFGLLEVESFGGLRQLKGQKVSCWNCICACGKTKMVMAANLLRGMTGSCSSSCPKRKELAGSTLINDIKNKNEYRCWIHMLSRCENPKSHIYKYYGGKGVTVCKAWHSFTNFLADMGKRPSSAHSLDRFPNNNGNYEPGNCRWATRTQQQQNKSNNINITHKGKTMCLTEWARILGVKRHKAALILARN